jgi:Mrp family chromosome partitioning ATPase/capsular polysaccharide biosynthesis protein
VEPPTPTEAPVRSYLAVLWRSRWLLLAAMLIVPIAAVAFSLSQQVRYGATARVLLNTESLASSLDSTTQVPAAPLTPERIADTQAELARVTTVAEHAVQNTTTHGMTAQGLLATSSVSSDPNSDLLSFTVNAPTREQAEALATAYAQAFTAYRSAIDLAPVEQEQSQIDGLLTELRDQKQTTSPLYAQLEAKSRSLESLAVLHSQNATVVQRAQSASQVQPKTTRNAILGLSLGLLLGIALAFVRQAISGRVVTPNEVGIVLGLPLLGRLCEAPRAVRRRGVLATVEQPDGRLSQAYRLLRATIDSVMPQRSHQVHEITRLIAVKSEPRREVAHVIAVCSATHGDGRSTTVANLGVAFARAGRRVVLVNADMRSENDEGCTLDRLFGLDHEAGLADLIRRQTNLDRTLVYRDVSLPGDVPGEAVESPTADELPSEETGTGLWVMPAGSPPVTNLGDPTIASRLDELLAELASRFDVVLIDPPPLLLSADSLELVGRADAAVVVVRAKRIAHDTLTELARMLSSSPAYKMGFVLTDSNDGRRAYARERFALRLQRAA